MAGEDMTNAEPVTPADKTLVALIAELFRCLGGKRRKQFFALVVVMLFASVAEVISIASVIPLLGIMASPDKVFEYKSAQPFIQLLGVVEPRQLLFPVTMTFCIAAVVAGAVRIFLLFGTTRYSFAVGADLSVEAYKRTLYQPYPVHLSRSSSEVINGIMGKVAMTTGSILMPLLTLISSFVLLVAIFLMLFSVEPIIILLATILFGGIYTVITMVSRRRLQKDSASIACHSTQVVKALQEGLGAIRDVLLDGTQEVYCRIFQSADREVRRAQGNVIFLSGSPRFLVETTGLVMISLFAFVLTNRGGGLGDAIPMLGVVVLGAQRLLPLLQNGYSSVTIMAGAKDPLRDVLEMLKQPLPDCGEGIETASPMNFRESVVLKNVGFRYSPDTPWVFRGLNLVIPKGQRLGVVGKTGCGKSTLLDLIMGLLSPTEGVVEIDGEIVRSTGCRSWQRHVAHVPQTIFLMDSSVEENIALGVPRALIDRTRVKRAAAMAHLAETVEGLKDSYDTFVGERGVRLSGGQRQRIGIARALYKNPQLIVFDEATSALDNETERSVMEAISGLGEDITVIICAHRISTLSACDKIIKFEDDGVVTPCRFEDLVSH